jgi:hypothetical protein
MTTFADESVVISGICYLLTSDSAEMITDSSEKKIIFKLCYFTSSDSAA